MTSVREALTRISRLALSTYRALPIAPAHRQKLKHFLFAGFGFACVRMGAYQRWKAYRQIDAGWPAAGPVAPTAPAHVAAPGTTATTATTVTPVTADGIWEWRDYEAVRSRIGQIKSRLLSQVTPSPLAVLDIKNEPFESVAARVKLPAPPVEPEVSIILPVFNQLKLTLECLLSIAADPDSRTSFEIILADDASTDATPEIAGRIANLRVIRNQHNLGFLRNCNNALGHVRGRYVVYLNNDVQVATGWLAQLRDTFASQPNVGAAGPRFVYPSGHLQEAGVAFRNDGTADMIGLNDDSARPRYGYVRRVDYISGACLMLPTDLARQLGGFSEEFLPCYFEDSDLCLRVQAAGYDVYYNPASTIIHHLSKTTAAFDSDFKLQSISANLVTLQQKWQEHFDRVTVPRVIAFYLPQPSTLAVSAVEQDGRPIHDVLRQQVDLARRYGIQGFCFHYHGGQRLTDSPLESMLTSGQLEMPFCLCWSDQDWKHQNDRQDDGDGGAAVRAHSPDEDGTVVNGLIRYLQDPRYIRLNGRPLIVVDHGSLSPEFGATVTSWRTLCRQQGLGEIYIAVLESGDTMRAFGHPGEVGCDAAVERPPQSLAGPSPSTAEPAQARSAGATADYRDLAVSYATRELPGYTRFKCVISGWDNQAPQSTQEIQCLTHATPGAFQAWLEEAIEQTRQQHYGDERLVFIHAWNDWAAGAHLEPGDRFGHTYLEAVHNATESARLLRQPRNWHGG